VGCFSLLFMWWGGDVVVVIWLCGGFGWMVMDNFGLGYDVGTLCEREF